MNAQFFQFLLGGQHGVNPPAIHHLTSEHGGLAVSPDAGLGFGIVAATIAPIGAGTVATYWEIFPVDLLFWLLLGVMTSLCRRSS